MTITAQTRLCAVIGDPIGHSLSPVLHNAWIAAAGLDAVYGALRLDGARAEEGLRGLKAFRLAGLNITVPLKEAAAALADRRDRTVLALGAANTWRWADDGAVEAHNTDAPGFLAALDEALDWRSAETVLVIGAGGAARAIAWALADGGRRRLRVVNRAPERAAAVAALAPGGVGFGWDALARLVAEADVIVNATSLGMVGQPQGEWPLATARPGAIAVDAVYRPVDTPFLSAARAAGMKTVDGLGMLIHQAALAFAFWFGVSPDPVMGRAVLRAELERGSA